MKKFVATLYFLGTKFQAAKNCGVGFIQPHFLLHKPPATAALKTNVSCRPYSQDVTSVDEAIKLRNTNGICWKCRKSLNKESKFFCSDCGTVLPIKICDHFTLFDFKPHFQLSTAELQKIFKQLQTKLHPDKFSMKDQLEVSISESVSSELNKAYSILLKPLSRGMYMLELEGAAMEEEVRSDDAEFLMEIMELNEKVADMASSEELREVFNDVKATVDRLTREIADAFQQNNIMEAKKQLIKFKYFDNVLQKLKDRLPPT